MEKLFWLDDIPAGGAQAVGSPSPQILRTPEVSFADDIVKDEFKRWALQELPILLDGKPSGNKAIFQNGDLAHIASSRYTLIPNETVLEVMDELAAQVGAKKFHEFTGQWYCKTDTHYVQDGHRIHALYAFDEPVEVAPGDTVQMGWSAHNSIDGSCSLHGGIFQFRHACSNMFLLGYKSNMGMSFDDRKVLDKYYQRHVGELPDWAEFQNRVELLIKQCRAKLEMFRISVEVETNQDFANSIIRQLPRKVWPSYVDLAVQERETDPLVAVLTGSHTVWGTFNDLTEAIWHDPKTGMTRKMEEFKHIDRMVEVAVHA
ncbi:DUF932 domain-containing protein [Candidatus Pacearchaeota archaeon]|nr:DUF932 domain-containing protein [Candidatus Pacearchaeota archaeon]